jgi:hypothetical protein
MTRIILAGFMALALGALGTTTAKAGEYKYEGGCRYEKVAKQVPYTTYEYRREAYTKYITKYETYTKYVTKYDHCYKPYQCEVTCTRPYQCPVTCYRDIQVPVTSYRTVYCWVKVCNYKNYNHGNSYNYSNNY